MYKPEPILILAKRYNQFKAGEGWLWENGYFKSKRPIRITQGYQLRGLRNLRLFIMDEAESTEFAIELAHSNFKLRNKVFDMNDLRDSQELKFKITERI
jgi:hypothetical protein